MMIFHGILDFDVIDQNLKSLDQLYSMSIKDTTKFDERYFVTQNLKIKTPMKMLQSPFNARIGPM